MLDCTGGRTDSSAAMTVEEMALAITLLDSEQTSSIKKMRAKMIHLARDIFGLAPKDKWEQEHYDRLNTFLLAKFKAPLHKLTYQQLPNAVTAVEAWQAWEMKQVVKNLLNPVEQ